MEFHSYMFLTLKVEQSLNSNKKNIVKQLKE